MTTLGKLTEIYINDMTGGRPNSDDQFDERFVAEQIRNLLNEVLRRQIIENYSSDDRSNPGTFKVAYHDISIQKEANTGRKFAELPEFFLSLPHNKGLASVYHTKEPYNSFYPCHTPEVTAELYEMPLSHRQPYHQEGMKIFFHRKDVDKNHKEVSMVLVIAAPEKYDIDDVLPLTSEMASQVIALMKERRLPLMPQDQLSDNKALNAQ